MFNSDALGHALIRYPEDERSHILDAQRLGKSLALEMVEERKRKAESFLKEAKLWEELWEDTVRIK